MLRFEDAGKDNKGRRVYDVFKVEKNAYIGKIEESGKGTNVFVCWFFDYISIETSIEDDEQIDRFIEKLEEEDGKKNNA